MNYDHGGGLGDESPPIHPCQTSLMHHYKKVWVIVSTIRHSSSVGGGCSSSRDFSSPLPIISSIFLPFWGEQGHKLIDGNKSSGSSASPERENWERDLGDISEGWWVS